MNGTQTASDLAVTIATLRSRLDGWPPCSGERCDEVDRTHLELASTVQEFIVAARRERPPGPPAALDELADVLAFDEPSSHRRWTGWLVISSKRTLLALLKPFHVELLRPQQRFNLELLSVLHQVASLQGQPHLDISNWVRTKLEPLAIIRPSVSLRRRGVGGRIIRATKSAYLKLTRPWYRRALMNQEAFNLAAVTMLTAAATGHPSDEALRKAWHQLAAIYERCSTQLGMLGPLLAEVLRRQWSFNQKVTDALRELSTAAIDLGAQSPHPIEQSYSRWRRQRLRRGRAETNPGIRASKEQPVVSLFLADRGDDSIAETTRSVLRQRYSGWKLHVVSPRSRPSRLPWRGARMTWTVGNATKLIDLASEIGRNDRAEFVGFLRSGDRLAGHALSALVRRAELDAAEFVYSDEEHSLPGRLVPDFKPDFSPDLLRSYPYIPYFFLCRLSALHVGETLSGGEGHAGTYPLILRIAEGGGRVAHVAELLYRTPHPVTIGEEHREALAEHLQRRSETEVRIEAGKTGMVVRYPILSRPLVSIIVPFRDRPDLLTTLLSSLDRFDTYRNFELLLVSNNSVLPQTHALLEGQRDPRIKKLSWDHPFNYSAINNFGARHASGELLLFLNNDIEALEPGWLEALVGHALRPEVGAVGAKLLFPNGRIQHAGVVVGLNGFAGHPFVNMDEHSRTAFGSPDWTRNCLAVTGACLMIRRQLFDEIGRFDERFIVCGSDVELCLRVIRAGKRVVYTPHARLVHAESSTRRTDSVPEGDFWHSFVTYRPWLQRGDPYYNPNLSLSSTNGALASCPETAEQLAIQFLASELRSTRRPFSSNMRILTARHRIDHSNTLDATNEELSRTREQAAAGIDRLRRAGKIRRIDWFVPDFKHPFGGIQTLLRFSYLFQQQHQARSRFIVYDNASASERDLEALSRSAFPDLQAMFKVLDGPSAIANLEECDLAVATLWKSAYAVLRHPRATAKAYFVQDFEPLFYPAGTEYAQAEETYRMGLYGIFNSVGLHDYVTRNYPMRGTWFEPAVDRTLFHPNGRSDSAPCRVFFYARPSSDRNAFELGIAALMELRSRLGSQVDIVSAGELWNPEDYGIKGIKNLGVLPYEKTADLYRQCHVGLCFMFTKHPSYLPLELMASGVAVVTNANSANEWLLNHEENCLTASPTRSAVLEQLLRVVTDLDLQRRLSAAALLRVGRTTWEAEADKVMAAILK